MPINVLAISGSLRTESYNRKALQVAKEIASDLGAETREIDLRELNLPIFDQDIQDKGLPESVKKMKAAIEAADILLICSPEYNYSIPGGLKNAIDWASREGNSFKGKVGTVFGVSSGRMGTVRGQVHLRDVLTGLNVIVVPTPQIFIGPAPDVFNPDWSLKDPKTIEKLTQLIQNTLTLAQKLRKETAPSPS